MRNIVRVMIAICLMTGLWALNDGDPLATSKARLRKAGYEINAPSLLQALSGDNQGIAAMAAAVLGTFPKDSNIISGLYSRVNDEDEFLSVGCARSLLAFGETAWVPQAAGRLPGMHDQIAQIQLAGLVAEGGNTEGWPVVVAALSGGKNTADAIIAARSFHGRIWNGKALDVATELETRSASVPPQHRALLGATVQHLRSKGPVRTAQ